MCVHYRNFSSGIQGIFLILLSLQTACKTYGLVIFFILFFDPSTHLRKWLLNAYFSSRSFGSYKTAEMFLGGACDDFPSPELWTVYVGVLYSYTRDDFHFLSLKHTRIAFMFCLKCS